MACGTLSQSSLHRHTRDRERKMTTASKPSQTVKSIFRQATALLAGLTFCFASGHSLAQTPLVGIAKIAAGNGHTCAVTTTGTVKCWGLNFFGQLGDNSTTYRNTPVDVIAGPSLPALNGVSAITTGLNHTCVLIGGGAKCWGDNGQGQLGDGSTTQRLTPVDVSGLAAGVVSIAAAGTHTCAVTSGGGIKCWGQNLPSRLGDNTITQSSTPVDVIQSPPPAVLSGATAVAAGARSVHTCAIVGSGVRCWGSDFYGQLGIDMPLLGVSRTALAVVGLASGVSALALGAAHSCALTTSGGIQCWGNNDFGGQLGDNTLTNRSTPVDVSGLTAGAGAITAGTAHTCALTTGGGAKCWGSNNIGQLGDNSMTDRLTPVDVSGLASGVTAIAAGDTHTCALISNGGVKCWGFNGYGQLGDNTNNFRLTPVDVILPPPITLSAVKSRKIHALAGPFDLVIDTTPIISGAVTVESRSSGATHLIVFQFNGPITATGVAAAVNGSAAPITISAVTFLGNDVSVTLTGVADKSRATVSLAGVNGVLSLNPSTSIGFLVGDVNNSRSVDSSDISSVKARSGQTTDTTNFKFDVNSSGAINSSDISAVKARFGLVLP